MSKPSLPQNQRGGKGKKWDRTNSKQGVKRLWANVRPDVYKRLHEYSVNNHIFMSDIISEAVTKHLQTL